MLKNIFHKSHLYFLKRNYNLHKQLLSFFSSSIHSPSRPNFIYKDDKVYLDPAESSYDLLEFMNLSDIQLRKSFIFIPHFTIGSIVKVVWTDKNSPSGLCQFTGMCTRVCAFTKIGATFVLRNSTKTDCVSVTFEKFSPIIRSIELLRLQEITDPEFINMLEELPPSFSRVDPAIEPIYTKTPIQFETRYTNTSVIPQSKIISEVNAGKLEYAKSVLEITKSYDPYYNLITEKKDFLQKALQEKTEYSGELLENKKVTNLNEPDFDLTIEEIIDHTKKNQIKSSSNINEDNNDKDKQQSAI